ncbi:MAG: acyl-CoA thioesterase [Nitrospirae bacterium YQR-1]
MSNRRGKAYFETSPAAPPPLTVETQRVARFEEVDSLHVVWHGRYPSYFEDGRAAFGGKYSFGYMDMYNAGFLAPIYQLHFDYHTPIVFPEEFRIITRAIWSDAARLNFEYELRGPAERLIATGYSVQLLTDLNFNLLVLIPQYLERFRNLWKEGKLHG